MLFSLLKIILNNMKKTALVFLTIILLTITPRILAGGGLVEPISIQSPNGQGYASVGQAYTLSFRVHKSSDNFDSPESYCKQCPARILFYDPQKGDILNPVSEKTDDNGIITAKLASGVPYIRYAKVVTTLPNGQDYEGSKVILNYTGKMLYYPETERPEYNLPKQDVPINEDQVDVAYQAGEVMPESPQRDIGRTTPQSYGVPGGQPSIKTSPQRLPAIKTDEGQAEDVPTTQDVPSEKSEESSETAELQKQIDELEQRMAESQKKQNALEQTLSNLIGWIKLALPFFK